MNDRMCFMLDIETNTADKAKAEVMEIGILACKFTKQGIFLPSDLPVVVRPPFYHTYLHYHGQPETNFARKHQVDLYQKCNDTPVRNLGEVRQEILKFFEGHHVTTPVHILGLNASSFDMPILSRHGIMNEAQWVDGTDGITQELVGDYHYRIEDITGARMLAMRVTGLPYDAVTNAAMELCPEIGLPEGKAHDAIYDCYRQVKMYSGLIRLVRGGRMA